MRPSAHLLLCLTLVVGVLGCPADPGPEPPTPDPNAEPDWPTLQPGTLSAGASGGYLDVPVGVPLGGFTSRDKAFGANREAKSQKAADADADRTSGRHRRAGRKRTVAGRPSRRRVEAAAPARKARVAGRSAPATARL